MDAKRRLRIILLPMETVRQGNNRLQAMRASKFCGVFMTTARYELGGCGRPTRTRKCIGPASEAGPIVYSDHDDEQATISGRQAFEPQPSYHAPAGSARSHRR